MGTGIRKSFLLFFSLISISSYLNATDISELNLLYMPKQDSTLPCRENECNLFIHVIKSSQKLYLYENGVLIDSFSTSTGNKNHPTPDINMSPVGPTFIKYTSRKYPGGNYQGL